MTVLAPYSGSLLRLALRTIAIVAVFAAALAWWEHSGARAEPTGSRPLPAILR